MLFSEKEKYNLKNFQVFIVDTVGILTKTGVHNVLEPGTFGIPILIGTNYHKFNEAIDLVKNRVCFVVNNSNELSLHLGEFFHLTEMRTEAGKGAEKYVVDKA